MLQLGVGGKCPLLYKLVEPRTSVRDLASVTVAGMTGWLSAPVGGRLYNNMFNNRIAEVLSVPVLLPRLNASAGQKPSNILLGIHGETGVVSSSITLKVIVVGNVGCLGLWVNVFLWS